MPRTSNKSELILNFVNQFVQENGFAPSVREIGAAVGLRSTASVSYHLNQLQDKGLLLAPGQKGRKRAIVTAQRPGQIPVVGVVTAGVPILALENQEGTISWDGDPKCFALRVRGDSMIGAGILSGDMVVVRPQQSADDGQIVGDRLNLFVIGMNNIKVSILPFFSDLSAKTNGYSLVCSGNQRSIGRRKPYIGQLYLITVNDSLLEHAVIIKNRASGCGIIAGGQGVHKASCKSSQTSVTKSGVCLQCTNIVKVKSAFTQNRFYFLFNSQVHHIVFELSANQKLNAKIVNSLGLLFLNFLFKLCSFTGENILYYKLQCAVKLFLIRICNGNVVVSCKLALQGAFQFGKCLRVHVCVNPSLVFYCSQRAI